MVRTQIQLTEAQSAQLREIARERGVSLAAAIRECVGQALSTRPPGRAARYAQASSLVGAFRDREGRKDVAKNHDRHFEDSIA